MKKFLKKYEFCDFGSKTFSFGLTKILFCAIFYDAASVLFIEFSIKNSEKCHLSIAAKGKVIVMDYTIKAERYRLTREIAEEGIVLLKNKDSVLPIGSEKVAVFGRTQINTIKCGTGSAFCLSEYQVNVLDGIRNAGIAVDEPLMEKYIAWEKENPIPAFGVWGSGSHIHPEMPITKDEVCEVALRGAEKAIVVLGRTAGENDDVVYMEGDYMLSSEEKSLLEAVCHYFSKVIIVINSGNLIDLSFTEREEIKAVVLLNLPGMEGGNALGNILSGKVSPSAKLTDTVARHYGDYPGAYEFGARSGIVQNYHEDIFVGYRYFETFPYVKNSVLYPFGHGLSYTTFEIKCAHFECDSNVEGKIRAVVSVKNTGNHAGKEVVMLYTSAPRSALGAPAIELRAFDKTELLQPGEEAYLSLSISISDMASFDDTGVLGTRDAWVMPAGEYGVFLGNNVEKVTKIGSYDCPENKVIKTCVHMDTELAERLKADGSYEKLPCIPPDPNLGFPIEPNKPNRVPPHSFFSCDGDLEFLHAGEKVTYRLNVSAMGMYRTHFHVDPGVTPEYEILLNGLPMIEAEAHYKGAEIILPMGTTEITFCAKKDGKFAIRSITLEKNDEPTLIDGENPSYLQGGKYVEAALWVFNKPFYDPDGVIKSGRELARMHTPGRYAMYRLNVKKAGFYDVRLRFENRHPQDLELSETFSFLVSNVTQDIEKVTLEQTEPHKYSTSAPIRLAFPKGEVFLNVVSVSTLTPRIAYFEFTPSTRTDVKVEERAKEALVTGTIGDSIDNYERRPLSERRHGFDFRDVLQRKLSMNDFVESLSDEELALLTCGNSEGRIGYMPNRGIPEARWSDGPVGLRLNDETTVYPSGTMLAASFNTALAKELGRAIGDEAHKYNIDVWLAPAINIHRNPCCGRNFEYNSEDPVVAGEIASAIINGVQEKDVAATVKHFAANNTEYQRMRSNSRVSARALREIYMKAFEIVIKKSNPYSIMTSYNHINGTKVCEDPVICRGIMRQDFGYLGVLMTDFSNDSIHVKELRAGHDLKMHFGDTRSVIHALEDGSLPRETVRKSVKRILEMLVLTSIQNEKK